MLKIKFDEFVRLGRGFDLPNSKIKAGEYPVVASTSIKGWHNEYKVEPPVVVTGRSGSLGTVQYINQKCWPLNTSLYSKDFRDNYPLYVYYYMQTMALEQFNAGAGVPTLNQNHLRGMSIIIHEKIMQKRIADFLHLYDLLIANNNKRIKILEQMAENLYKEWFVRFRFPGHEQVKLKKGVPQGWKIKKLKEMYYTSSGGTPSRRNSGFYKGNIPWVKTGELKDTFIFDTEEHISDEAVKNSSAKIFTPYSLLVAMYAGDNVGNLGIATFKGSCNQACCVIKPKNNYSLQYLFYHLKNQKNYLQSISFGAAQQNISQDIIKELKILVAPKDLVDYFNEAIFPMLHTIEVLLKQNVNLEKQRDLLLPRLMSGKLEVK